MGRSEELAVQRRRVVPGVRLGGAGVLPHRYLGGGPCRRADSHVDDFRRANAAEHRRACSRRPVETFKLIEYVFVEGGCL